MKCPICEVDLKMAERQGVEIDYCPQCRGVWLDRAELDKIIERSMLMEQRSTPQDVPRDDRDYNDDWDDRTSYAHNRPKKESFLGNMFDLFD